MRTKGSVVDEHEVQFENNGVLVVSTLARVLYSLSAVHVYSLRCTIGRVLRYDEQHVFIIFRQSAASKFKNTYIILEGPRQVIAIAYTLVVVCNPYSSPSSNNTLHSGL